MLVTIEELGQTSLYPEIIDTITRGNPRNAVLQLMAAEDLCKSYLIKYDLDAAFGTEDTPPTVESPLLKKLVKTIASYYLVRMANPNVDIALYREDYEHALQLLADIRDGNNSLALPYAPDDPSTPEDESTGSVAWSSEAKRKNYF